MFCPACGNEYQQKLKFCKACGANLGEHKNTVEADVSKRLITSLTWATALFGLLGGLTSLLLFVWSIIGDFGDRHYKEGRVGLASVVCLLFTSLITVLLVRQLGRLISGFQETSRQTNKEQQFENNAPPQAVLSPVQPLFAAGAPESPLSVTENTTRSLRPVLQTGAEQGNI